MRSRLVHEWRGVVDGWYFVPFQTRRKPRRQDFGVRLKSCRLNLRLPNQPSTLHNPSVVFSLPRLTPFRTLILLAGGRRQHRGGRLPPRRSTSRGKAPWLLLLSTFILTVVGPWNVYGTRKLTATKSKGWCHRRWGSFKILEIVRSDACASLDNACSRKLECPQRRNIYFSIGCLQFIQIHTLFSLENIKIS